MKWNFTLELLLKRVLYALTPGDWNFFWFQTSAARSLSLQSVLRLLTNPWSHVLQPQFFFLSTLNLSGETLCQKLHFMYYRRPLREYSCVINFHFKAKSSWNDVSEWVWSGANSNGNKKNEINNNAQRETASHSGTQQKYVFLKTWMRVYFSRLSLHTHTFRSRFWFLALLPHLTIVWKQVSNCMRWATHYSIFSSLLYHLRSVATCQPPSPSTSTVPLNPVGSNWPGVLHDREWCWELDGAC